VSVAERLPSPIETDRLLLTALREDDADEMVAVLSSPSLYTYTGGEPPSLEDLRRRYAAMVVGHSPDLTQEWLNWVVRRRDGAGAAVGTVQATVDREGRRAEVAWVIGADGQGRGYAAESAAAMVHALVDAGVPSVIAHIHPDHAASEAVARRCGLAPTDDFHDGERRWELTTGTGPADQVSPTRRAP
jgi:RimJ/RimL family protein N-acetyltransferase